MGIVLQRKGMDRISKRPGCIHLESGISATKIEQHMGRTQNGRCLIILDYYSHIDFLSLMTYLVESGYSEFIAVLLFESRGGKYGTAQYTKLGIRLFRWTERENAIDWVADPIE